MWIQKLKNISKGMIFFLITTSKIIFLLIVCQQREKPCKTVSKLYNEYGLKDIKIFKKFIHQKVVKNSHILTYIITDRWTDIYRYNVLIYF